MANIRRGIERHRQTQNELTKNKSMLTERASDAFGI